MGEERAKFFVYTQNKAKVKKGLKDGDIDYGSFSKMGFIDEFFAFLFATDFFPCLSKIPTPAPG